MTSSAPAPRAARGAARYRLTGRGSFEALFHAGKRREGQYLQIVYAPARTAPGCVGYVIGSKALPRAVDRNRIRRMLRPIVHAARPGIEAYDLIVRLRRTCPRAEFAVVAAEAARLLSTLPAPGEGS